LGAPASNLVGPTSRHPSRRILGPRGFGGAIFETIRRFYGTDHLGFSFVSDEFNGVTKDHQGNVRPYMPRSFSTLSQLKREWSKPHLPRIHWRFDKTAA